MVDALFSIQTQFERGFKTLGCFDESFNREKVAKQIHEGPPITTKS